MPPSTQPSPLRMCVLAISVLAFCTAAHCEDRRLQAPPPPCTLTIENPTASPITVRLAGPAQGYAFAPPYQGHAEALMHSLFAAGESEAIAAGSTLCVSRPSQLLLVQHGNVSRVAGLSYDHPPGLRLTPTSIEVVREPANVASVFPPRPCAPEANTIRWESPNKVALPVGRWLITSLTQEQGPVPGCLKLELRRDAEQRSWSLCVPKGTWPFAERDVIELVSSYGDALVSFRRVTAGRPDGRGRVEATYTRATDDSSANDPARLAGDARLRLAMRGEACVEDICGDIWSDAEVLGGTSNKQLALGVPHQITEVDGRRTTLVITRARFLIAENLNCTQRKSQRALGPHVELAWVVEEPGSAPLAK